MMNFMFFFKNARLKCYWSANRHSEYKQCSSDKHVCSYKQLVVHTEPQILMTSQPAISDDNNTDYFSNGHKKKKKQEKK